MITANISIVNIFRKRVEQLVCYREDSDLTLICWNRHWRVCESWRDERTYLFA